MRTRALFAAATVAVAVSACSGDTDVTTTLASAPSTSTTAAVTSTSATPTTTGAPTTTAAPSTTTTGPDTGVSIDVVVTDDGSDAEDRYEVSRGDEVTIGVTSTFADEVHVHGYDLFLDLEPDVRGEITFVADVPGVFEVEMEAASLPLFELVVE